MEIKKVLFSKRFLLGLVSGIFFTVCFIEGIQYGKSLALENNKITSSEQ